MKKCNKCETGKDLNQFHNNKNTKDGKAYSCKPCVKIETKKWNSSNKEKVANYNRKNLEKTALYLAEKRKNDPKYRMQYNLQCRTLIAMRPYKGTPNGNTKGMWNNIGITRKQLYVHIENQFTEGMTWDNYGTAWELDHIIPCCSATSADEVHALNHYTNLRPLSPTDNMKKIKHDKKQSNNNPKNK